MLIVDKDLVYYLSGPMCGIKDHNYPLFFQSAKLLREQGFNIINPAELHPINYGEGFYPNSDEWIKLMKLDLIALINSASGLILLPNSRKSKGSRLEIRVAKELGMPVYKIKDIIY